MTQYEVMTEEINRLRTELINTRPLLTQDEMFDALSLAMDKIEIAGCSEELTAAVIIIGEIRLSVGDKWNSPQKHAADRVRAMIRPNKQI
jgi:hypothetical protein